MNIRIILLAAILGLFSLFITGCETEVELSAPYKSTPVIVSVLEHTTDTQFVRINRTFLSNQDADLYAQNRDSVEYDPSEVDAWLIKKLNGNKLDSILLEPIVRASRDPGAFYDTDITFWYTSDALFTESETNSLRTSSNPGLTFELNILARGERYIAETDFPRLGLGSIEYPPSNNNSTLEFYRPNTDTYISLGFRYKVQHPTARYQGVLRLNCEFELNDGTIIQNQVIDYQLGISEHPPTQSDDTKTFRFNAQSWYAFIGNIVKDIPNIASVRMSGLDFILTGANSDLNAYINVVQPISDFTPVLSVYSNISNDAIGILGTKAETTSGFLLNNASVAIMNTGPYSFGVSYCTILPWTGTSFQCVE